MVLGYRLIPFLNHYILLVTTPRKAIMPKPRRNYTQVVSIIFGAIIIVALVLSLVNTCHPL